MIEYKDNLGDTIEPLAKVYYGGSEFTVVGFDFEDVVTPLTLRLNETMDGHKAGEYLEGVAPRDCFLVEEEIFECDGDCDNCNKDAWEQEMTVAALGAISDVVELGKKIRQYVKDELKNDTTLNLMMDKHLSDEAYFDKYHLEWAKDYKLLGRDFSKDLREGHVETRIFYLNNR